MSDVLTTGWPDRLLELADWEVLPVYEVHNVECSEGILVVRPKPGPRHQYAMARLANALDEQVPDEFTAVVDVEVLLPGRPLTVRAPDVLVTADSLVSANLPRLDATDVLLAVEILSEGSRRTDRVTKMSEYAEAGIPDYWIVDLLEPVSVRCHRLGADGTYREVGRHYGRVELPLLDTSIRLDLAELAP